MRQTARAPTPPVTGVGRWRYEVVHSLAGRVRLRLPRADRAGGPELARRLAAHGAVTSTRWLGAARSLTVCYDPTARFADIAASLLSDQADLAPAVEPPGIGLWRQFLLPGLALGVAFSGPGLAARAAIGLLSAPIFRRAVRSLLARRLSIDLLDVTAIGLLLITGDVVAAGVSVALIETGERVRQRASGRARRLLRGWMGADAAGVRVQRPTGEPRLPVAEVVTGERVVVYAGESVPVDGVVREGDGLLDNRTWTGEAVPRHLGRGAPVLSGASLVSGRLVIEVTASGEDTRAARLAAALEDAIAANTRTYDRARRIASAFVGPAFGAAGLAWLLTRDFGRVVAILIVDFGTGVRVAIPTTVLTTMISGGRQGVLFRSGQSIDDLARVDTVVFDKTGTLTTGNPVVVDVRAEPGADPDWALRLAAGAEGHLHHPLARAIRRAARRRGLEVVAPDSVRHHAGGLIARIDGHQVVVGDRRLLAGRGVVCPDHEPAESSVVLVAVDGRLAARIRLRDRIKESARAAVKDLRSAGIGSLWLATGDHIAAARPVARQLGLDHCLAHLMPEDKVRLVRELRRKGRAVALVGDGINDAAAMAEADVGVAVPRGAELAREAADVVLLDEDLRGLAHALSLARGANSIIRQNVGLVAAPNAVGFTVALAGRLTPLAATMVNNGSTLLATANALRPLFRRRASKAPSA